jgi:SAM-dependent methyltransferase
VSGTYYRADLARVHHAGFGAHADHCAPGILALLEPVLARRGLVVELGCGSGILTRHLVDAGHRVIATDASPAMVDLARTVVPDAEAVEVLVLPDARIPDADAVVSVGHVLCYLPDEAAVRAGLRAAARAVRPGGVLALDLCDLEFGRLRSDAAPFVRVEDDWAIVTRYAAPRPERFVRDITTFVRGADGSWRRDDERHDNVLVDTAEVPALLADEGIRATVRPGFDDEPLVAGMVAVVGTRAV